MIKHTLLDGLAKKLAKTKPDKAHAVLYEALKVAVLAGDSATARRIIELMYGGLPAAKKVITALSTHAIDVVCAAAGFGDLTRGQPTFQYALVSEGTLAERVAAIATGTRARLTDNAFAGDYPTSDAWRRKKRSDAWYEIDRFRRIQALLRPDRATAATEADARTRLGELLADWPEASPGPGMGAELALAFDLELRADPAGADTTIKGWLAMHGARIDEDLVETFMCIPSLAAGMLSGGLRGLVQGSDAQLATAFAKVLTEGAVLAGSGAVPSPDAGKGAPRDKSKLKVQKREVSCEYSQVHLEPHQRTAAEARQVFFQDPRESAQGMSLFATMVGIATPSETEAVSVEVTATPRPRGEPDLGDAVQAVAFPLTVRGPIVVRSATADDDDEPLVVLPGDYDVLALFVPVSAKKRGKGAKSGLRRFVLRLDLRPGGSLSAPRCYRLEDGSTPPARYFRHR